MNAEVQVKKHFTAEELSMRRQEMARRRRNLSEKRNEEVKVCLNERDWPNSCNYSDTLSQMETINKLLKKQAPKINRKAANGDTPDDEVLKPNPIFVRWVSNKAGSRIAVPDEMLEGPAGKVFVPSRGLALGKMVEEVA